MITMSWDDGHPSDLRVAEIMLRYGFCGTFYVPNSNSEGKPTLSVRSLRELARQFEIGGHGKTHRPLTRMRDRECVAEIEENRDYLENTIGSCPNGFCLIRGMGGGREIKFAQSARYKYVRTIISSKNIINKFNGTLNVSRQFYNHNKFNIMKGGIRAFCSGERPNIILEYEALPLSKRISLIAAHEKRYGRAFHLWGHSWELDELDLWGELEETFKRLSDIFPPHERVDNNQMFLRFKAI